MNNTTHIFHKVKLTKWLLTISLTFSLWSLSGLVLAPNQQIQVVSTAIFQPNGGRSFNKGVDCYYTSSPKIIIWHKPGTENKYFVLLNNLLVNIRFSHLASQFSVIREAVQKPCITFIFHHSGQE